MMNNKKIAILGGMGHIAKGLAYSFASNTDWSIFIFSRDKKSLQELLKMQSIEASPLTYNDFMEHDYDIIINCIGVGQPSELSSGYIEHFEITERYDNLVLRYLEEHPDAVYINFTSGAAYGNDFSEPVRDTVGACYNLNFPKSTEYYGISKLYSEYKHRAFSSYNIVDIRLFSYFSHYIGLDSGFLLSDAVRSIINGTILEVSQGEMWRDYVSYNELYQLIQKIILNPANMACDTYSLSPISKHEMLTLLQDEFGLKYKYNNHSGLNPTGAKSHYYSLSRKAELFGYYPNKSSSEIIVEQIKLILA